MILYRWMVHKHTDTINWVVKDHIFLGHFTHLSNFHQYSVGPIRHYPEKGTRFLTEK